MPTKFATLLDRPDGAGLATNVLVAVAAVTAVGGALFHLAPDRAEPTSAGPSGTVVGLVWTGLFALMGVARWRLAVARSRGREDRRRAVTAFAAACLAYPLYAVVPGLPAVGLAGNAATVALALLGAASARRASGAAALLILPVVPWVAFASLSLWNALR